MKERIKKGGGGRGERQGGGERERERCTHYTGRRRKIKESLWHQ